MKTSLPPKELIYLIILKALSKDIGEWLIREEVMELAFKKKAEYEKDPEAYGREMLLCSSKPLQSKAMKVTIELFPEYK